MVSLDGKLGAPCLGTCRRLLSLGIQVLHVPLDPWQLGVTTDLVAPLGDEDHPCLAAGATIGQLVANH